jgi:hypothetical protein
MEETTTTTEAAPAATGSILTSEAAPITQAPATTPPSYTDYVGEGGAFRENWRESLSEDIRADPSLEYVKDVNGLAKSYVSGQKMVGLDKVAIPTEHSTQDVWDQFYAKGGRPETAEAYNFDSVVTPEQLVPTSEELSAAKTAFHTLGLNNTQAAGVMDFYNQHMGHALEMTDQRSEQTNAEAVASLKAEKGYAYDSFVETANKAVRTFDPDGVITKLGLENNLEVVKMMGNIGKAISEDKLIGSTAPSVMSPLDAQTKVNKIYAEGAYYDGDHPEHNTAVAEVRRLMQFMYPSGEASGGKVMTIDPVTGHASFV